MVIEARPIKEGDTRTPQVLERGAGRHFTQTVEIQGKQRKVDRGATVVTENAVLIWDRSFDGGPVVNTTKFLVDDQINDAQIGDASEVLIWK